MLELIYSGTGAGYSKERTYTKLVYGSHSSVTSREQVDVVLAAIEDFMTQ